MKVTKEFHRKLACMSMGQLRAFAADARTSPDIGRQKEADVAEDHIRARHQRAEMEMKIRRARDS